MPPNPIAAVENARKREAPRFAERQKERTMQVRTYRTRA